MEVGISVLSPQGVGWWTVVVECVEVVISVLSPQNGGSEGVGLWILVDECDSDCSCANCAI